MTSFNGYWKTRTKSPELKESLQNNVFGVMSFNSYKYVIRDKFRYLMMFIIGRVNDECKSLWEVINIISILIYCLLMGLFQNRLTFFFEIKMLYFLSKIIFLKRDLYNFRVISWRVQDCNFIKKNTLNSALTQVFSCEFCQIFRNTFFTERLRTTASHWEKSVPIFPHSD